MSKGSGQTKRLRDYRHGLSTRERYRLLSHALDELSDSLEKLGFDDYQSYLKSRLWSSIRKRTFGRAKGLCEGCGMRPPDNVHHWSYSVATLQGDKPQHLEAVCRQCHAQFHEEPPRQQNPERDRKAEEKRAFWALVRAGGIVAQQPGNMRPRLVKKTKES